MNYQTAKEIDMKVVISISREDYNNHFDKNVSKATWDKMMESLKNIDLDTSIYNSLEILEGS